MIIFSKAKAAMKKVLRGIAIAIMEILERG